MSPNASTFTVERTAEDAVMTVTLQRAWCLDIAGKLALTKLFQAPRHSERVGNLTNEGPEQITQRGSVGSQARRTCLLDTPGDSGILPGERIGLQVNRVGPHRQETALGKGRSLSRIRNCSLDVRRARYLAFELAGASYPLRMPRGPQWASQNRQRADPLSLGTAIS